MNITDDLYQQTILDYNRSPRNFYVMENATHQARGVNPLCGDDYTVYLRVNSCGVIEDASFYGQGCAVSKASASLMTQELKGKTTEKARCLFHDFRELTAGRGSLPGKPGVFSGVWKYPERVKCAMLAWHAADSALPGRASSANP